MQQDDKRAVKNSNGDKLMPCAHFISQGRHQRTTTIQHTQHSLQRLLTAQLGNDPPIMRCRQALLQQRSGLPSGHP